MKNAFLKDFEENLYNFYNIENSIVNIEGELESLKTIIEPHGFNTNSFNNGGSDFNSAEIKTLNYISKGIVLSSKLKYNKFLYSMIVKAFETLERNEKVVIDEFYFKNNNIAKICNAIHYEERQVYRIKNKALYKMICFCYGKVFC